MDEQIYFLNKLWSSVLVILLYAVIWLVHQDPCWQDLPLQKKHCDNQLLDNLRNELTVTPYIAGDFGKKPQKFKVYRENEDYLALPKYYGLNNVMITSNCASNVPGLNVQIVKKFVELVNSRTRTGNDKLPIVKNYLLK